MAANGKMRRTYLPSLTPFVRLCRRQVLSKLTIAAFGASSHTLSKAENQGMVFMHRTYVVWYLVLPEVQEWVTGTCPSNMASLNNSKC
jgi:hypothetical protein